MDPSHTILPSYRLSNPLGKQNLSQCKCKGNMSFVGTKLLVYQFLSKSTTYCNIKVVRSCIYSEREL